MTLAQLDARPDSLDFRDHMYAPTLVEVPREMPLESYRAHYPNQKVPLLNQGAEGACTGFALAAVANFLLQRRKVVPDTTPVSARMFYEMARRYDEWPGEKYTGSSARGAMKGWHKHGVCSADLWPYDANNPHGGLDHLRALEAACRPLGAYLRVNHRELAAMHSALAEVGILFATGRVHHGWSEVQAKEGVIPGPSGKRQLGVHAFAIVGYDARGFWLQNSWGARWGKQGFALIRYDDWLANGTDVWVARLGAPTAFVVDRRHPPATAVAIGQADYTFTDLRPHVVCLGNNGKLRNAGTFATSPRDLQTIFKADLPRLTASWPVKRVLLYAHGGLVPERSALKQVEDYRRQLLDAQVYPLAFIWNTDFMSTLGNILKDALAERRPEGFWDAAKDFMLDRLDDTLELLARAPGKGLWDEIKENAALAMSRADGQGGAKLVSDQLRTLLASHPNAEIHIAAHSAGSIFMAPLIQHFCGELAQRISSVTLWAPACSLRLFKQAYLPAIRSKAIKRFALFTLKDQAEQDDNCAGIYHKSLLYLVSNALEEKSGLLFAEGEPLLGMERFILKDASFKVNAAAVQKANPAKVRLFGLSHADWIRAPNGLDAGNPNASHARSHGAFDNDAHTVEATLARILNQSQAKADFKFRSSVTSLRERRKRIEQSSRR